MSARQEAVVVGGGAMGSATAWHLARRGRQVTRLEHFGASPRPWPPDGRPVLRCVSRLRSDPAVVEPADP